MFKIFATNRFCCSVENAGFLLVNTHNILDKKIYLKIAMNRFKIVLPTTLCGISYGHDMKTKQALL